MFFLFILFPPAILWLPYLESPLMCKGWEKQVKSEHLCCNFSHFVLLLLCCRQAVSNLFSQKPALTLKLAKTAPREARSRMSVWMAVVLLTLATSSPEVPGNISWLPWKSSLEALKWGGLPLRSWLQVLLLFLLFKADAFPWTVCFPWTLWAQPFHVCVTRWRPHLTPALPPSTSAVQPSSLPLEVVFPKLPDNLA